MIFLLENLKYSHGKSLTKLIELGLCDILLKKCMLYFFCFVEKQGEQGTVLLRTPQ